ncbi:hypothetical protein FHS59_002802 [Algoriphagus iocasae]|uniref:Lipoprotein n=1 Tax=Algoriphagus iocasae TaxID=1836499 RepID=A0A841MR67_9BACT|nr:hypothetical protein [Algoriphagus iocasae]MBB6327174.1 hypothetical protein [Algoriphagus iocasae]
MKTKRHTLLNQWCIIRIFIPLLFLFNTACQGESPCTDYQLETPVEVDFKSTINFCSEPVSITFSKLIGDSRCPENVQCIWQGLVELEVILAVNGTEEKFTLSSYPPFNGIPSEVEFKGYLFKLMDVTPYPNTTKSYSEKDYTVILEVEKTEE